MPLNRSTLIRLKTIDRCLQNHFRRWTLEDLMEACGDALYEFEGRNSGVSRRTIQGDIQLMRSDKLGYNAPIVVKDKKYYTYDDPDYSITHIPLSEEEVATLNGAVDILRHFQIFPQLAPAADVINKLQEHIAVSVRNNEPAIDLERNERYRGIDLLSELYEAVRSHEPLIIYYQSFRSDRPKKLIVSPYLLKEYRNRWFLLGTHRDKVRMLWILAVDRIQRICHDDHLVFVPNPNLDTSTFFDDVIGVTKNLGQRPEQVNLRFDADQAPYVLTKPLHRSQQVERREADGSVEISIWVVLNFELEREILGYAEHVEVLAPPSLRHRIHQHCQLAAIRYNDDADSILPETHTAENRGSLTADLIEEAEACR